MRIVVWRQVGLGVAVCMVILHEEDPLQAVVKS
jgi:hypothetical protein